MPAPQEAEHCKGKVHLLIVQKCIQIKENVQSAREPNIIWNYKSIM